MFRDTCNKSKGEVAMKIFFKLSSAVVHVLPLFALAFNAIAIDEVKILFSGYSTYHISYDCTREPSGSPFVSSEELELLVNDGKGNESILESGSLTLTGEREVPISSPGNSVAFKMRLKIIDTNGNTTYESIWDDYAVSKEIRGKPKFNCLIEGSDPASLNELDFGGAAMEIPAGVSVTIKNVKANNTDGTPWQNPVWKTYFALNDSANLVIENCEFLGFDVEGKELGKGSLKLNNCVFAGVTYDTYCSMKSLDSVEVITCRFDGSSNFGGAWSSTEQIGRITVSDSLFFSKYSNPTFNALNSTDISTSEFFNKELNVVAQPSAPVKFSDCVFRTYVQIDNKIGAGAIDFRKCHFWSGDGILVSGSAKPTADSCYFGYEKGLLASGYGWLGINGASSTPLTVTNLLGTSQAMDKISSRTEPRAFPQIWVAEKVIGQNILLPIPTWSNGAEYLMRKGRETMISFDVRTNVKSLESLKFHIEWNGEKIYPVNPSLVVRRDYGMYGDDSSKTESRERPDERTLNFIVPADKTYVEADTLVRLFCDTTGVTGYDGVGYDKEEPSYFYVTFKNPFARKLRVAVLPINIMAIGYKHYIDPGNLADAVRTIQNDLTQKWPLKPDEELEVIRLPAYSFWGAVSSVWGTGFKMGLTYELAMSSYLANALVNNKPIDRYVAIVPAGSIKEKGLNASDYPRISIVREDALFSSVHELGHSIGLYVQGAEQYDLPSGPDAEGNQIEYDAGAYVHGLTCFKPDAGAPRSQGIMRRYRHIPVNRYGVLFDFMGIESAQWTVKSSLKKVYEGLDKLLGTNPNPPKPVPAGYKRVFFSGLLKNSAIAPGTVFCRHAGELICEIREGEQKLSATLIACDEAGKEIQTADCVFSGQASESWPWFQTFDVKEECARYELRDAQGKVFFDSDNPGVMISNAFQGPPAGPIQGDTVKLNFSATPSKSGRRIASREMASSPILHQLYCSYDGGTDWLPIGGAQFNDGELEVQTESLVSSGTISFKLVSANGFTQTEKILDGYSLGNHAPSVSIASPQNGASAQTGMAWTLSATAFDVEDGIPAEMTWTSSVDGILGAGTLLEGIVLSDGVHTLSFSAKDSAGASGEKSVTVTAGQAAPDLSIAENAISFHLPGTDPIAGNPAFPQIGKANKLLLSVRNQGIDSNCSLKLYVTAPGVAESLLSEAAFDLPPFAEYKISAEYTPPAKGDYSFRASFEASNFIDPDTSNNSRTWTFSNNAPVARDVNTLLLEAGASEIMLDADDEDGDELSYSITQAPANGTAVLDGGIVTYTPSISPGISSDTFKYKANDGSLDSNEGTISIEFQFDLPDTVQMSMAVAPANGGSTSPSAGTTKTVNAGDAQNISANPAKDFSFAKWISTPDGTAVFANANSASTTATLYGDTTITATFTSNAEQFNLTVAVSPLGSGTTSPAVGTHPVNAGVVQNISTTANAGYAFANWTADANAVLGDANSEKTTVTISGNSTLTANFTKIGLITATSPNGGEQWPCGSTKTISWTLDDVDTSLKVELLKQGVSVLTISETASGGTLDWQIPEKTALTPGAFYKIRISKPGTPVSDESDEYFSITGTDASIVVTSPLEGAAWLLGSTHDVTWTSTGDISYLNIYLYQNGAEIDWIGIIEFDDGIFSWEIPPAGEAGSPIKPGTGFYIKVLSGDDYTVSGASGKFSIIESATAELSISSVPEDGGDTDPVSGTVTVAQGVPQGISADPAPGFTFMRWQSSSPNAKFANPLSSDTTVTLTGDAEIFAIFSEDQYGVIFDAEKTKLKIQIDDSSELKDKISVTKGTIPAGLEKPDENSVIAIYFDDFSLDIEGECKSSDTKTSYKGQDADKSNKFSLIFDFKKMEWSFILSKANIKGLIDNFDGIDVALDIDGELLSQNIDADEQVSWSFSNKDGSNPVSPLDPDGMEWSGFDIADLKGKMLTDKDGKDALSVSKAFCDSIDIDPDNDAVLILIDDAEYDLADFDPATWTVTPDFMKHSIKAKMGNTRNLALVMDFTKNPGVWKLKLTGCDFEDLLDGQDGLDLRIMIGEYEGAVRVPVFQKRSFVFPKKED